MIEKTFTEWLKDIKVNGTPTQQKAKAEALLIKETNKRIEEKKRQDDETLLLCLIACM